LHGVNDDQACNKENAEQIHKKGLLFYKIKYDGYIIQDFV